VTHSIGSGTVNLTINVPIDERLLLGRASVRLQARSVGDLVKRLLLRGLELEDAATAVQVREIRRRYYGIAMLAVGLLAVAETFSPGSGTEMRRARTGVRVVRTIRSET
jgi:hypothetical protein